MSEVNVDTHELAWAAGFFDGEGHIRYARGARKNDPQRYTWKNILLEVPQKDRRVLDRFQRAVGHGKIYGPYRNGSSDGNKTHFHFRFSTGSFYDIQDIVKAMWPWLSEVKWAQAQKAIDGWLQEPRLRSGRKKGTTYP